MACKSSTLATGAMEKLLEKFPSSHTALSQGFEKQYRQIPSRIKARNEPHTLKGNLPCRSGSIIPLTSLGVSW
ncbi:hypothetical protein Mapa_008242 [Marchantia paleacea]|nr:hypothetical protein Mapa_008242 [Marchantia paleacea]